MPVINVSGSPGQRGSSSSQMQPGLLRSPAPTSQVNYLRPGNDAAFASNQRNIQSASDDYAKALRQRAQQERATALGEQRLQREQERAFREHERRQREVDRTAERQSREEQRHQNQVMREDAKRQKDLERRMEQREREETRLRNTQVRYDRNRGNRFDRLNYQSNDTLTPTKFRSLQRQIDLYKREFPSHAAEIMGLETGAGSAEGAIRVAHAMRLGHAGQRAASLRDRRSLRMAEADLQLMERDVLAALKSSAQGSPERADAVRLQTAIKQARMRIAVGKGLPISRAGVTGGLGRRAAQQAASAGGMMSNLGLDLFERGGWPGKIVAGALFAESTPFLASTIQTALQSISTPYMNLRRSTAQAGRTSGFSSRELEAQIFQGANAPDWMKALGLSPQDAANLLNKSGVITRSPGEAAGVIRQIGGASLRAGMGLSMEETGGYAKNLATLGLVRPGSAPFDLQQEYDRLGKLMAQSTAAGLDHSSTLATMEGLLRAGAASGAPSVNAGGLESLFSRMLASGAPSARTGQSEMSFLSGYNASVGSLGPGNLPATLMVSAATRGHAPSDDKSLARFLGMDDKSFQELKSQPNAGRLIDDYLQAQRRGDPNAYRFLGVLMQNHPELAQRITNQALPGAPQYLRDIAGSSTFGTGLSNYTQNASGRPSMGLRNNNPLNLSAAGQPGLVGFQRAGDNERVGTFATMEAGIAAGYHQILLDQNKAGGKISIRQLLNQWSPNGQFNDSHAAQIASNMGISPDAPQDFSTDTTLAAKLMRNMAHVEGSDGVAEGAFRRGILLSRGAPVNDGNSQSDVNQMSANTGAAQTLAGKDIFNNVANTKFVQGLESALGGVATVVTGATTGIEKAFADVTSAIERGGLAISHAFGGPAGPRVAPNGTLHMPDPFGNSMRMGAIK